MFQTHLQKIPHRIKKVSCRYLKYFSKKIGRGERGKMGQKNIFAHYEKNIHVTQKMFILHCRACLFYFAKFFHGFGFFILPVIQFLRITKIFRNKKKWGGGKMR